MVQTLTEQSDPFRKEWYTNTPPSIRHAAGKFKFLAVMMLMGQYNLGGGKLVATVSMGMPDYRRFGP